MKRPTHTHTCHTTTSGACCTLRILLTLHGVPSQPRVGTGNTAQLGSIFASDKTSLRLVQFFCVCLCVRVCVQCARGRCASICSLPPPITYPHVLSGCVCLCVCLHSPFVRPPNKTRARTHPIMCLLTSLQNYHQLDKYWHKQLGRKPVIMMEWRWQCWDARTWIRTHCTFVIWVNPAWICIHALSGPAESLHRYFPIWFPSLVRAPSYNSTWYHRQEALIFTISVVWCDAQW